MPADSSRSALKSASVRWARIAVSVVLVVAVLDWVGWATGIDGLTRLYPTWPQMTPWAALWLAALGTAILVQSGSPSPGRVWIGRILAAAVGGLALVVLAQYAMGRSFGVDHVWFRQSVQAMEVTWPGRPSAQTALAVLFMSVVVGLTQVNGWFDLRVWSVLITAATVVPDLTVLAYLFDTFAMVNIARSLDMAVATALGLILLATALVLVRPDRGPVDWWLHQTNKWSIFRMAVIVGGFPISVGVARHVFLALGAGLTAALALSTAVGTVAVAVSMARLSQQEQRLIAANEAERALLQANSDGMLDAQALFEAVRDPAGRVVDLSCLSANRALCSYLGLTEQDLLGHSIFEDPGNFDAYGLGELYVQCVEDGQPVTLFELPRYSTAHDEVRYYDLRLNRVGSGLLSVTWSDVTERFRAAARIKEAEERYRRVIDNAAIGMCIIGADGHFESVNDALCQLLGYDAATLMTKNWEQLTVPEFLEADLENIKDLEEGRKDSFRLIKQYIHADGHRIWGDLSTACVRDSNGKAERFISQVIDITAAVEATERNYILAQRLELERERLAAELQSAAAYMSSIMPKGLTGEVEVISYYLPSRELGGDCFDYTWIDDDHLLVYLIDVSGHGVEPALLSVSVHNMIRSGSLGAETLLTPEAALTELNRLFQMDQQGDHYFTLWYGVYKVSTRTLRYVNAGAPAPLVLNTGSGNAIEVAELPSTSRPVGMFPDTGFSACDFVVPSGCQILIYSDGASEIPLADGRYSSAADFANLWVKVAGSPDASLNELVTQLRSLTPTGFLEDDCSLIWLQFD